MAESGFEGVEKKLFLQFTKPSQGKGLREYKAQEWQRVLDLAKCSILSCSTSNSVTAYVLSESSLFVFEDRIMIKTCGTTTLLNAIPKFLEFAQLKGLAVEYVFYCRKNFLFPEKQPAEYRTFQNESKLLGKYFENGVDFVFGPGNGENWNVFVADYTHPFTQAEELSVNYVQTLEIMMTGLDQEKMKQFCMNEKFVSAKHTTTSSGIADIIPGSSSDEFSFDPCGYSVNGLLDGVYYTIHVTPEPECSFVSFETNCPETCYKEIINKVVDVFRPTNFSVAVLSGKCSSLGCPLALLNTEVDGFVRAHETFSRHGNHSTVFCSFSAKEEFEGYSLKRFASNPSLAFSRTAIKMVSEPVLQRSQGLPSPFNLSQSPSQMVIYN